MKLQKTTCTLIAIATALSIAGSASAYTIDYTIIESGSQGGFGYSSLHVALPRCDYMCGSTLSKLSGTLTLDFDGVNYTALTSSTLSGTNGYELTILSGSVTAAGDGALDYQLTKGAMSSTGSFAFDGSVSVGPANSINPSFIALWGWNADPVFGDIGIDLGGPGASIPEPSAALVFGLGTLVVGRRVRRPQARAKAA